MTNLEQKIINLEERILKLETLAKKDTSTEKVHGYKKQESIREFLSSKKLDSDTQNTLAIAYFFEVVEGKGCFNADNLKVGFRTAKLKVPSNINDRINQNIKQNFMMEAEDKKDGKKAWELTNTGEKEVENSLSKEDE